MRQTSSCFSRKAPRATPWTGLSHFRYGGLFPLIETPALSKAPKLVFGCFGRPFPQDRAKASPPCA